MASSLYLQTLCLTTTPYGHLLDALTAEEHDRPAYQLDTEWFADMQRDPVLIQHLWPHLLRPAPPRAIICDNYMAVATTPGDLARQVGLAYLSAVREISTLPCAGCWLQLAGGGIGPLLQSLTLQWRRPFIAVGPFS